MARARRKNLAAIGSPGVAEALERAEAGWLAPLRQQLAEVVSGARLPHALLLIGLPGVGQAELAVWLSSLLLCDRADGPCGECAGCQLLLAGNHPDFYRVGIEEDATRIKVEQVRQLSADLALRSYRGGRKVALIDPADWMNANSANALLKTLEEPPGDTVLLLVASRVDRLPATVRSRCTTIRLPVPPPDEALAWLQAQAGRSDWSRLLELVQGAPFEALRQAGLGLDEVDQDMRKRLSEAGRGQLDILAVAKAWSLDRPDLRLSWLEDWLANWLKHGGQTSDLVNNNHVLSLSRPEARPIIRSAYGLLDSVREARQLLQGSLNVQLLFEGLVIWLVELTKGRVASVKESLD